MYKKSLWIGLSSYVIWGMMPLFWHLLSGVDSLVILCCRVLFSGLFTAVVLAIRGDLGKVFDALKDRRIALKMIAASIFVTANWGLYIWSVNSGHVLDASLAYYINPLMTFALGMLLFHDACTGWDLTAIGLAVAGVVISTVSYGAFPWAALSLAGLFAIYGVIKKQVHMDAVTGICLEALLTCPLALGYLLLSGPGQAAIASLTLKNGLLLMACGPATAVPLILYARGVNDLPLSTMGFLQYVCPTLILLVGVLFLGERFTEDRIASFAFILAGLTVYTVGIVRRERRQQAALPPEGGGTT